MTFMNQSTITTLLSRLITQLEQHYIDGGDRREFADRLAQAAWSGLVMLMRHSFAQSDELLLEEVGHFRKREEAWTFLPAETLLEADSLRLPVEEASTLHAHQVLFYLDTAAALLRDLPHDVELSSAQLTAEEKLGRAIFGEQFNRLLSQEVKRRSKSITRLAAGLEKEKEAEVSEPSAVVASRLPAADISVTRVSIDELEISVRTYNTLKSLGVSIIGDIIFHWSILSRALDPPLKGEIEQALRAYGFELIGTYWGMRDRPPAQAESATLVPTGFGVWDSRADELYTAVTETFPTVEEVASESSHDRPAAAAMDANIGEAPSASASPGRRRRVVVERDVEGEGI